MGPARYRRIALALLALAVLAASFAANLAVLNAVSAGAGQAVRRRRQPEQTVARYPAGWWQRHTNSADGYVVALPPEWRVVSLDAETLAGPAQHGGGRSPLAERLLSQVEERTRAGAGVWLAAAPADERGQATTVNIIRQPLSRPLAVGSFARANVAALQQAGQASQPIRQRRLKLSAGQALYTELTCRAPENDGPLHIAQVYLVREQNGYVVTGVTPPELAEDQAPIIEGIVRSLRWIE